jgi:hypothetical protein
MVGEIRDQETAEIAIKAALTGHLVFSTLHTNDTASSFTRLIDVGIKPFLVASGVRSILAQRLVRTICTSCKEPTTPDPIEVERLGFKVDLADAQLYHGAGCDNCNHTGHQGRLGAYELLITTDRIRQMIMKHESAVAINAPAREEGMIDHARWTPGTRRSTELPPSKKSTAGPASTSRWSASWIKGRIRPMANYEMVSLLRMLIDREGSDLHLAVQNPPCGRVHGHLQYFGDDALTADDTERLMKSIASVDNQQELQEVGGADFGFAFEDIARFRVSIFKQRGYVGLVLRLIPRKLMTFEEMGLPQSLKEVINQPRGMILVTGPTGSGKSTSLGDDDRLAEHHLRPPHHHD